MLPLDDKKDSFVVGDLLLPSVLKLIGADDFLMGALVDKRVDMLDELLTELRCLCRGGGIGGRSVLEKDFDLHVGSMFVAPSGLLYLGMFS